MTRNTPQSNRGEQTDKQDEQQSEQTTLCETVDEIDLEPPVEPDTVRPEPETDWVAGIKAGTVALITLSIGTAGLFYLLLTGEFHIVIATAITTTVLLELTPVGEFLNSL